MLTTDEQTQFVKLLDRDEALREAVETLAGKRLSAMKFGEKVSTVASFLEIGRSASAIAIAARARRDLMNLASEARGETALADKLEMMMAENEMLRDKLAAVIVRAAAQAASLRSTTDRAAQARAVHSTDHVPDVEPHTPAAMVKRCTCEHTQRRHSEETGLCGAAGCECSSFVWHLDTAETS